MTRALRIELDGVYYHVISRGQRRDPIFLEDRDRERFLELLGEMSEKHGVRVHGYVLMGNHYHLLMSYYAQPVLSGSRGAWRGRSSERETGWRSAAQSQRMSQCQLLARETLFGAADA